MLFPRLIQFVAGAIGIGLATHLVVFIQGEWERHVPTIAKCFLLCQMMVFLAVSRWCGVNLEGLTYSSGISIGFCIGIFTSMSIYRVLFHPLRRFPGPLGARLTGFWSMAAALRDFKLHEETQRLHYHYGDFVRIRPREISINHVDAVKDIHGPGSKCSKGPFYDLNYPSRSLQMTRDKTFHSKRKRVWEEGFTSNALSQYERRILQHCFEMARQLSKSTRQPEDITQWIQFFSYDVMGDLVFGKPFAMLQKGTPHFVLGQMAAMGPLVASLICVPWLFILFQNLPIISGMRKKWIAWCGSQVEDRKTMNPSREDLFSHLLPLAPRDSKHSDVLGVVQDRDLVYDSELAIVAGSDTTATTLAALVYLLAQETEKQEILREEIYRLFPSPQDISYQILSKNAPYLDGCIKETLRLYPAVPSGVQRITPPEGAVIAGRFILGDTLVSTPTYALHRDSRYFVDPDAFLPQRWSSQPHLVAKPEAFNPFLIGPHSCVGRQLAMMEMRLLMATLIRSFTFRFPSNDGYCGHLGFKDYFTAKVEPFEVVVEKRNEQVYHL